MTSAQTSRSFLGGNMNQKTVNIITLILFLASITTIIILSLKESIIMVLLLLGFITILLRKFLIIKQKYE